MCHYNTSVFSMGHVFFFFFIFAQEVAEHVQIKYFKAMKMLLKEST